jgi:hypothetical protein
MSMRTCLSALALALTLLVAAAASAESGRTLTDQGVSVEEVLVTGEHPGPGLWKVSHGENSLWILGTHAPLPNRLVWRSQEVELVISEAQQVLGNYSASFAVAGANPFASKGASLRRLLPRKVYAQWTTLKAKYLGPSKEIETAWPVTAALLLRSGAYARAGLTSADPVWSEIHALANAYHVPVTTDHQVHKVIDSSELEGARARRIGVDYLTTTITSLESDLRQARANANAWATGDLAALNAQADTDRSAAFLYASSWPFFQGEELAALMAETDRRWLAAAEGALQRNRTTFAALPVFLLLRSDGLLDALRAKGFDVDEPVY